MLCSATLAQIRQLDKPFDNFIKSVSGCPTSTPSALLYGPTTKCAAGFPRLSDDVCEEKLAILTRCTYNVDNAKNACHALFERCFRETSTAHPLECVEYDAVHHWGATERVNWAHAPLEWLQEHNMTLLRGG